jgi:hypothetical protein
VLKVILGQHNKPKAAVHSAEMTGPLKNKKKKKKKKKKNAVTIFTRQGNIMYESQRGCPGVHSKVHQVKCHMHDPFPSLYYTPRSLCPREESDYYL